jgi:hypothetical protein
MVASIIIHSLSQSRALTPGPPRRVAGSVTPHRAIGRRPCRGFLFLAIARLAGFLHLALMVTSSTKPATNSADRAWSVSPQSSRRGDFEKGAGPKPVPAALAGRRGHWGWQSASGVRGASNTPMRQSRWTAFPGAFQTCGAITCQCQRSARAWFAPGAASSVPMRGRTGRSDRRG